MRKTLHSSILAALLLTGCTSSPTNTLPGPGPGAEARGVYVLNEGMFMDPLGARLSFHDLENDTTYLDVFEGANAGASLGSLGDDVKIAGEKIFIVMSGSENLAVLNLSDHKLVQSAVFPGAAPHDLLIDSLRNRIYLTRLYSGSVLVVDLTTLLEVTTIPVGANPQGLVLVNDFLFVCNSGFGNDRTVSVVNVSTSSVAATLTLSDGPSGAALGPDGIVWVVCTGNAFGSPSTMGALYGIHPVTLAIVDSVMFPENLFGGIAVGSSGRIHVLGVTGGSFGGGPVHRYTPSTGAIELGFVAGTFYAMAIDQATDRLYLADAKDFTSDGEVSIYGSDGTFIRSFGAQRIPGTFAFKR